MSKLEISEGYMPYLQYQTYYRTVKDPAVYDPAKPALVLLHGGPGSTHNYMEALDDCAETGRLVVMYDQLGCGNSYVDGHPELWKMETWVEELIALRKHLGLSKIHLLGQSFGGMLAIAYLLDYRPEGISSVILSSTLSSSKLWSEAQHERIRFLPAADQAAIHRAEETGNYEDPSYIKANAHFMQRHCCDIPMPEEETDAAANASVPTSAAPAPAPVPEYLTRPKRSGTESYLYAWGPNEYTPSGTLASYDYTDRLGEIHVPALIMSGTVDLCSPLVAKTMYDGIPNVQWELFPGARHMCFVEQNARYEQVLRAFLAEHDV